MKNYMLKIPHSGMVSRFVLIAFLSVFLVSCEKEQDEAPAETTVFNLLEDFNENKKAAPAPGEDPIAQIAIDNVDFNELVAALSYVDAELDAGLVDLFLNGKDQYTVFAPTDEAFYALYAALSTDLEPVDEITDLPADLVLSVLKYHVTEGRRAANSVVPKKNMRTIETLLEGATFKVSPDSKITAIGSAATIVGADISASNGIIHVIDNVLLPIE
ncbi:MAG: fasciclin domain-containing protein [Bacteroidota bacterium]